MIIVNAKKSAPSNKKLDPVSRKHQIKANIDTIVFLENIIKKLERIISNSIIDIVSIF